MRGGLTRAVTCRGLDHNTVSACSARGRTASSREPPALRACSERRPLPAPRFHRPDFPGGPGGGAFGLPGYPERRMRCLYCRWVPAQWVLLFCAEELSGNPPLVKADSARYARLLFALAIIKALNVLCGAVCRKPSPTSRNPVLGAIYRMKSRSKPKKMQNTVK